MSDDYVKRMTAILQKEAKERKLKHLRELAEQAQEPENLFKPPEAVREVFLSPEEMAPLETPVNALSPVVPNPNDFVIETKEMEVDAPPPRITGNAFKTILAVYRNIIYKIAKGEDQEEIEKYTVQKKKPCTRCLLKEPIVVPVLFSRDNIPDREDPESALFKGPKDVVLCVSCLKKTIEAHLQEEKIDIIEAPREVKVVPSLRLEVNSTALLSLLDYSEDDLEMLESAVLRKHYEDALARSPAHNMRILDKLRKRTFPDSNMANLLDSLLRVSLK